MPAIMDAGFGAGCPEAAVEVPPGLTPAEVNAHHRQKALAWLASEPLPRSLMARTLLVPLQRLQRRYIWVGSPAWERHEAAKEARAGGEAGSSLSRTYPIVLAAEGCLEDEASAGIRALLAEHTLWSIMPEQASTAKQIGLAFRMVSRAGGLLHRELRFTHDRFPFKLFLLIKNPEMAKAMKDERSCSRCSFTKEFMAKYDLEDPAVRYILLLMAKMLRMTIADVECRHAAVRRLLTRVQAKQFDLEVAGAHWVAQRLRRRRADHVTLGAPSASTTPAGTEQEEEEEKESNAAERKVRAPGLWRTFVALETAGQSGSPDLSVLAKRYHELTEAELERSREVAVAVARARRAGDTSQSITMTTRERARAMQDRRDEVQVQRVPASIVDPELHRKFQDELHMLGQSLCDVLRLARKDCMLAERKKKHVEEEERLTLQKFGADKGPSAQDLLLGKPSPSPVALISCFRSPCSILPTFRMTPNIPDVALKVASHLKREAKVTNLRAALHKWWVGKHKFVEHDNCPAIANDKADPPSQCWRAGVCLCSPEGKTLRLFGQKIMKAMKATFKRGTAEWQSLRSGFVVIAVRGREALAEAGEPPLEEQWWHMCFVSASPYEVTFQDMVWDGETLPRAGVDLQPTGEFYHQFQAFALCPGLSELKWACEFFVIESSDRPLPQFRLDRIRAYPLDGKEHSLSRKPRAARRPKPQDGPRMLALEDWAADGERDGDAGFSSGEDAAEGEGDAGGSDQDDGAEADFLEEFFGDDFEALMRTSHFTQQLPQSPTKSFNSTHVLGSRGWLGPGLRLCLYLCVSAGSRGWRRRGRCWRRALRE